jgi:enoyl-CoA hydratase/carnithine racemase
MATDTTTGAPALSERRGAVALITFNRPDRLNAWNPALEAEYFRLLGEAEDDTDIRAIVVTGAGRGFCAGADMEDLSRIGGEDAAPAVSSSPASRDVPYRVRKPMIAAINGPAAGLGLVEALYCDLRFCTPGAKLTTAFARRGLIAEYGISWLLPRIVGPSKAMDLLFSARVVLGDEALAMGLVDRLCEPDVLVDEAVAYATMLAENSSPTSMAIMKTQIRDAIGSDFDTAFAEAGRLIFESFERPDVVEGVSSYLEKRPPDFPPLPPRS